MGMIDIVEVIGQFVSLEIAGENFRGRCPFHPDQRPSFFVYPKLQTWHCFGECNQGGDVQEFVSITQKRDVEPSVGCSVDWDWMQPLFTGGECFLCLNSIPKGEPYIYWSGSNNIFLHKDCAVKFASHLLRDTLRYPHGGKGNEGTAKE